MATVYLHVGLQKTGTTAIQFFMRENEEELKKQNCCYPCFDLGMPSRFKNRNAQFLVYRPEGMEDKEAETEEKERVKREAYQILQELAKDYEKIVLSDELIWHRSLKIKNFWQSVVEDFQKIGCHVQIIVYLRRQDLFIQSLWNQSVKENPRTNKTFYECVNGTFFAYYPLDFYQMLMDIARDVGKENLIVRIMEKGQFEGEEHSIFSDFFQSIGLNLTDQFTKEKIHPNLALDRNFLEIKRVLNTIEHPRMESFARQLIEQISIQQMEQRHLPKTAMFTYEEQLQYLAQFEESNQKVAEEFLGREDGILFYEPVKELEHWQIDRENMYRDMLLVMGEMFCKQQSQMDLMQENLKTVEKIVDRINRSVIFRGYRKIRGIKKRLKK